MKNELILTKTTVYAMRSSDDERSASIKGYYGDYNAATIAAKGAGWYGSDGDVTSVELYTDGDIFCKVSSVGKLSDVEQKFKEEMVSRIKSKLSKEELEFLKINDK